MSIGSAANHPDRYRRLEILGPMNCDNAPQWCDLAAQIALESSPRVGTGHGITMCGGGLKYLPCVWVAINILRHRGCSLPIELWYLDRSEMPVKFEEMVAPLGVQCIDASSVRAHQPARILNGWELKPYSIIWSRFAEVIALDADNVVVADPSYLFDTAQYLATGAIFWPDFFRLAPTRSIWNLTGIEYRDEPEFETGQIVVDKQKCGAALALTMLMNEYSDFWYQHVHGDKETFHMAWRKLNQAYSMPSRAIHRLPGTMCQHDFEGKRLFQHRNLQKWTVYGSPHIDGFYFEQECLEFLKAARPQLCKMLDLPAPPETLAIDLAGHSCHYERIGYDSRFIMLAPDGTITEGSDRMERMWTVVCEDGVRVFMIYGEAGLTAVLRERPDGSGVWQGQWLLGEQMPVLLRIF